MNALHITQKIHVPVDSIKYLQADINYTIIHTCKAKQIISTTTIKRLKDRIQSVDFIRISKKYVLNTRFIKEYDCQKSVIVLDDGQIFTLSRRKNKLFKTLLEQI